jgi:fibrillarin-like pre-rRNA processing protein
MENEWNPFHSKWKAAMEKGLDVSLKGDENILYLGASSGTTVSFISELTKGKIFAIEKAPLMAIYLVRLAQTRENIIPIFADARDIENTKKIIKKTKINLLFQDIPSADQIKILTSNATLVDKDCKIFLSLKTQSISQKSKVETLEVVKKELEKDFNILAITELEPFHQKHYFLILSKK